MDTNAQPEPDSGPLASLPGFAPMPSQRLDPPLPPVPSPEGETWPQEADEPIPYVPTGPKPGPGEGRTTSSAGKRRWRPGGDPEKAAQVIGGALILITGMLGGLAARRGRRFRQPTTGQRDAVAEPLGRIAVRWLPMDLLGDDFADGLEAAYAAHNYISAGPLLSVPDADLMVEA